jgi:hypothetical protein
MWSKRIKTHYLLGLFGFAILVGDLSAQKTSGAFQVALPLGATLAQVEGDPYSGLRKWGLSTGIEGVAQLSDTKQLSLGILFQQLGAAPGITERKQDEQNYIDMRLSYIDIPITFHWQFQGQDNYYKMDAQLGFSFARQLSSRIVRTQTLSGGGQEVLPYQEIVDRQEAFEDFVWSGIVGASYYFHPQVALRVRYHHGLSAFFQPVEQDVGLETLSHRFLSMGLRYIIL